MTAIDMNKVVRVLLADGWHHVADGSFLIEAYDFCSPPDNHFERVSSQGFSFVETRPPSMVISGPLTSILAVAEAE